MLTFAGDAVEEVDTAKCSPNNGVRVLSEGQQRRCNLRDDGVDVPTRSFEANLGLAANVGEDILLAILNQGKLAVVAVGIEV